ncbi:MAG TPA: VOC family protein [Acidimicrobiales bacterium]|nr:VOC family protein [Acidimicrobiales bacterium]
MKLSLTALTFDCADASGLAQFWSGVLGLPVDPDDTCDFASIGQTAATQPSWMFIKVPEPKKTKNRFHVDLASSNLDADVMRLVALCATRIGDFDESGAQWVTLADPEGNEFDIVVGGH